MESFLEIFDIYLLEAVVNGILLGGLLALLALGLNLIFGVIDVTWICYAELVMIGMEAAFGARPTVTYYDNHVVVDNETGKVHVDGRKT